MKVHGTVRCSMKDRKVRPLRGSAPIRTLGGSPIRVAVPPIFAAMTMGSRKAEPLIRKRCAIEAAIG